MEENQFKLEDTNVNKVGEDEVRKAIFGDKPSIVGEHAEAVNHPVEAVKVLQELTQAENNQKTEEFYKKMLLVLDQLSS